MANRNADSGSGLPPQVAVELTDRLGNKARLPLSEVMQPLQLPQTQFARTSWLEKRIGDGKYGKPSEAVFQTYELPFGLFRGRILLLIRRGWRRSLLSSWRRRCHYA